MKKNLLKSCFEELRVKEEEQSSADETDEKIDCVPVDFRQDIVADM